MAKIDVKFMQMDRETAKKLGNNIKPNKGTKKSTTKKSTGKKK